MCISDIPSSLRNPSFLGPLPPRHPPSFSTSTERTDLTSLMHTRRSTLLPLLLLEPIFLLSPDSTDLLWNPSSPTAPLLLSPLWSLTAHHFVSPNSPLNFDPAWQLCCVPFLLPQLTMSIFLTKPSSCASSTFWQLQEHSLVKKVFNKPFGLTGPPSPQRWIVCIQSGSLHLGTVGFGRKKGQEIVFLWCIIQFASRFLIFSTACFEVAKRCEITAFDRGDSVTQTGLRSDLNTKEPSILQPFPSYRGQKTETLPAATSRRVMLSSGDGLQKRARKE